MLVKYLLLQIPGWAAAALILWLLWSWIGLPAWAAIGLFVADLAKDLVLYRFLRHAYADGPSEVIGPEVLVGARGVAEGDLAPSGYVRVRGERWRAEALAPGIAGGAAVIVRRVRGLSVQVEPLDEPPQQMGDN